MASNPINVNPQMQQLADNAVTAAREKFGISLDFTDNSLQQLEMLLQQAHERYKQDSSDNNSPNISIENTVRVWGSYFGEVIRRSMGGDWIVDNKDVFLQLGSRRLDPLGQVRSRLVDGHLYNVQTFFGELKPGIQNIQNKQPTKPISDSNKIEKSRDKTGLKNRSVIYIAGIIGMFFIVGLCILGIWIMQRQGMLTIPALGNLPSLFPNQTNTLISTSPATPAIKPQPNAILVGNLESDRAEGSGTINLVVSEDGTSISELDIVVMDSTADCSNGSTGTLGFGQFDLPLTGPFLIEKDSFGAVISTNGKLEGVFTSPTEASGSVDLIVELTLFGSLHTCDFGTWNWSAKLKQ